VSEGINERRQEKGLRPRPVRAAVVGFPNVGKSALINRLLGRAQCISAQRPGVTRHLQWVSMGAEGALMLLDAPGVLPMRLHDQAAAVRLAICNDIGEASYTTSLVAADFVEQLRRSGPAAGRRMEALEARFRLSPRALSGAEYLQAVADLHTTGDVERAARRILGDFREGKLGNFCLDSLPAAQTHETAWEAERPSRRIVKENEKAVRAGRDIR